MTQADAQPVADAVRSFADLRCFADENAARVPQGEGDAFLSARALMPLPQGPVTIGIIRLEAGSGEVDAMPADEFLIAHQGSVELEVEGQPLPLAEGGSVVLTKGARVRWKAMAPVVLLFMRKDGGPEGVARGIAIDEQAELVASGAPLAELLVGPTPSCRNHTDYLSEDGVFICGTWDSTPYHRRAMRYGHYELMHLLQGSVTFVDETGRQGTFVKGDIFLLEQGAMASWESREDVKKVYAIYRPA